MLSIPDELKNPYETLLKSYEGYLKAVNDYKVSKTPKYYSIPSYFESLGLQPTFDQMKELAVRAENKSFDEFKLVKKVQTPIGVLYEFRQDVLDHCFQAMTPKFN